LLRKNQVIILIHRNLLIFPHNPRFSVHIFPTVLEVRIFPSGRTPYQLPEDIDALLSGVMKALHMILHKTKEMVIGRCQIRTVRRVRENFPPHVLSFFQGQNGSVRPSVIVLQDDLSSDNLSFKSFSELNCALFQVSLQSRPASHVCRP